MDTKLWNKSVRDKIPEIIAARGEHATTRIADTDVEFVEFLKKKLLEEAQELYEASDSAAQLAELADVQEVLATLLRTLAISDETLTMAQKKKNDERGGFEKRIILLATNK